MGFFDALEEAAGIGDGAGQAGAAQGAVGAVLRMLQTQPGGIMGVIQKFESAGLGGVAQSWLGGAKQPVSPGQVQSALGAGPVADVAQNLGVSPDQAAGHIAQFLPMILGHLSPNGQPPAGGGLGEIEGLLSRFGGGQAAS